VLDEPLVVVSVVVVDEPELMPLLSVPEALEPVPLVEPAPMVEPVPLVEPVVLVPLELVLPIVDPVLFVVPELVVPAVPLVELGLVVLVPGPGLAVLLLPLLVPVAPVPVLPVEDEPAPVPELPPADDCAYEKPVAASRDAVAAAMARPFEIWFMV
jgi:hypothetical protein